VVAVHDPYRADKHQRRRRHSAIIGRRPANGWRPVDRPGKGEFGHAGDPDPTANTGPSPGKGLQYFKLGPYRDKLAIWGAEVAAINIRNIMRGHWEEGAKLRQAMKDRIA
jgi:hypothetical protein